MNIEDTIDDRTVEIFSDYAEGKSDREIDKNCIKNYMLSKGYI